MPSRNQRIHLVYKKLNRDGKRDGKCDSKFAVTPQCLHCRKEFHLVSYRETSCFLQGNRLFPTAKQVVSYRETK